MKKYKICVLMMILILFFGILPNIIAVNEKHDIQTSMINVDSVVSDLQGVIVLCIIEIENTGSTILSNIDWTFNAEEENGRIIFGDGVNGRIPLLESGEKERIILAPFPNIMTFADGQSPVGFGNIIMTSYVETSTGSSSEDQIKVFLIGPFMLPMSI